MSVFENKRVLVTGSSGFIAGKLIQRLQNVNCTIIRLTRDATKLINLSGVAKVIDIEGTLDSKETLDQIIDKLDIVYHFSAQTSVNVANEDSVRDLYNNIVPLLSLLRACHQKKVKIQVFLASTVTMFGLGEKLPINEHHPIQALNIYDIHKQISEIYLKYYTSIGTIQGVVLRLANVYGPGPTASSSDRGVLNFMIRRALSGETLNIYGTGEFQRDYIYIDDVVEAFLRGPAHINNIVGKHFIIASGESQTITHAIKLVAKLTSLRIKNPINTVHIEAPLEQPLTELRNFVADIRAYRILTGWQPKYNLEQGIEHTLDIFNSES